MNNEINTNQPVKDVYLAIVNGKHTEIEASNEKELKGKVEMLVNKAAALDPVG